jgi:hypothetical protein
MAESNQNEVGFFKRALGTFAYSRRALGLVWTTSRSLTLILAILTILAGILPAAIAYIGHERRRSGRARSVAAAGA